MTDERSAARDRARVPAAEDCVLRDVLERHARERGEQVFFRAPDGRDWSYAAFRREVCRTAHALRALGVRQGDHVLSWLPNGTDALRLWFGLNYLGAVYVPVNTAYRGGVLQHVIANSGARLMVAHAQLVERLLEVDRGRLERLVTVGAGAPEVPGLAAHDARALAADDGSPPALERPPQPWDTQAIIYTSGTTGPSKGVLSSYMHIATTAGLDAYPDITGEDRFLVSLPLFHVGATAFVYAMLLRGGSFALVDGFQTDRFWQVVDETGSTATLLLGVMATFLLKQPPAADDRSHRLRIVLMLPLSEDNASFGERFGVDVFTVYNMTETSVPLATGLNPKKVSSCGRPRPHVEVRLVDEHDIEVPPNTVGELVVRSHAPWALNHGYNANSEATAAAWRNGWFHTGDAFRMDDDGDYYFVDRMKDAIRRRGENVSSFEVEVEACQFPAVREAAAVAVPGEFGEDEILLVVSPKPDAPFDVVELLRFMRARLAYFMVPRYVRVMDELPKTPTHKVQKVVLRREGLTPDTFDRETRPELATRRERLRGEEA